MRLVIQRVTQASVQIDGQTVGSINNGLVILVGVTTDDTLDDVRYMASKVAGMRIFEDENGKMNLSIQQTGGSILSISQFTLYADCRKGNRPSFIHAAKPEIAEPLYDQFNKMLHEEYNLHVETGKFGADMKVNLLNDGPVTIILDSKN